MSQPTYWTMQVPVLSTAHLSQITVNLLTEQDHTIEFLPTTCAPYPHGLFVYMPGQLTESEEMEFPDLEEVRKWYLQQPGSEQGGWVRFDADGDKIDDLTEYDW